MSDPNDMRKRQAARAMMNHQIGQGMATPVAFTPSLKADELNLDEWKLLFAAWEKYKDIAFESDYGTWRRLEQCGLVMLLQRADAKSHDPCWVSITPAGETALSDRSSWLHDPTTGTANDRHDVAAEALMKDGWRFSGRVAPLHLLFETMSQLLAAREEIAALRAGNTAQVTVDKVVAIALDDATKEIEREHVRWQQAAARSDAERQRRQNSVHGTLEGIVAFGGQVLVNVGTKENRELCIEAKGRRVALVLLDDETEVPKNKDGS